MSASLLGLPIMYAENLTICPLIDTLMLPRDLYIRYAQRAEEKDATTVLELHDFWDRPVTNTPVSIHAYPRDERIGLFYDGSRTNHFRTIACTDANGRITLPLSAASCSPIRAETTCRTEEGLYEIDLDERNCQNFPKPRILTLKPSRSHAFTPQKPDAPFLGIPDCMSLALDGKRLESATVLYSETPVLHKVRDYYYTARPAPQLPDVAAYWDAECARLNREVPFAAEVVPCATNCGPDHVSYTVSFPSFGRTVRGFLSVPRAEGRHPVRICVAREGAEFAAPPAAAKGEIHLALNVFAPECPTPETYDLRYGAELTRSYALDGLERGREAYFFHPFILGAVRGVSWVLDRPDADPAHSTIEGISQGAGMGLWLMALEPRLQQGLFVNPSHAKAYNCYGGESWPRLRSGPPHENRRYTTRAEPHLPYFNTISFVGRIQGAVSLAITEDQSETSQFELFRTLPANPRHHLTYYPYSSDWDRAFTELTKAK